MPYTLWNNADRIALGIVDFNARDYHGGIAIFHSINTAEPAAIYAPGTWTTLTKDTA